ncbi:RNA-directed DNA polymerase, eukaryota, reverse transcriptase zinc-binding domain protein, partial [Tanacetum coccineum]
MYAANTGTKRKSLWRELRAAKSIINDSPLFLAGDFNVTLKLNEHSVGGSSVSNYMQDLIDYVNDIEIEDICFMSTFGEAYGQFLPFVTSDHSEVVLTIQKSIPKKFKAFRFANYIMDKPEFNSTVKKGWELEVNGCSMFRVVKKLKALKSSLNKLNLRNGDLFDKVTKLKEDLKHAQIQMEKNPHNSELKNKEAECLENYIEGTKDWKQSKNGNFRVTFDDVFTFIEVRGTVHTRWQVRGTVHVRWQYEVVTAGQSKHDTCHSAFVST